MLGNTVVWKPSSTQPLASHYSMRILQAAGLPQGVINMVPGDGQAESRWAGPGEWLAGIHFTGSTEVFQTLWQQGCGQTAAYRDRSPAGGRDRRQGLHFCPSLGRCGVRSIVTTLVRGAFEYQGQKCSAASRAYLPRSLWEQVRDELVTTAGSLSFGDVSEDLSLFGGAVIDIQCGGQAPGRVRRARSRPAVRFLTGGEIDDSAGYFVRPTILECDDPADEVFTTEYFGPILAVHVYEDAQYPAMLSQAADVAPYALTGAILATDRKAIAEATDRLRYSAGNFYINDKPTGAVVGQQPFGGARASGTDDKAGSVFNLIRWVSTRTIKETFTPPTDYRYPHMG